MNAGATHYILIDHENVHTLDPGDVRGPAVKVLIFLGKQTTKLPVADVKKLMALGDRVELVTISGQGKNALDFHIAYHIGRITALDPSAIIHVVSKDTGFDPLMAHLRESGTQAQRSATVPGLPSAAKKTVDGSGTLDPVVAAIDRLASILSKNKARPRRRKTLTSTIAAQFPQLGSGQVEDVIAMLIERGMIAIDERGVVTYQLS